MTRRPVRREPLSNWSGFSRQLLLMCLLKLTPWWWSSPPGTPCRRCRKKGECSPSPCPPHSPWCHSYWRPFYLVVLKNKRRNLCNEEQKYFNDCSDKLEQICLSVRLCYDKQRVCTDWIHLVLQKLKSDCTGKTRLLVGTNSVFIRLA